MPGRLTDRLDALEAGANAGPRVLTFAELIAWRTARDRGEPMVPPDDLPVRQVPEHVLEDFRRVWRDRWDGAPPRALTPEPFTIPTRHDTP